MFVSICLMTLVMLASDISNGFAMQVCTGLKEKCRDNFCNVTLPCEHGTCAVNGWCQCHPCWKGASCEKYVDKYPPAFLETEEEVFISDPWTTEPIYIARSYDEDLYTTCSVAEITCECAKTSYSLVASSHEGLFSLDNSTGEVLIRDGSKLKIDSTYTLFLSVYHPYRVGMNQSILELRIIFNDFYGHLQNQIGSDELLFGDDEIMHTRSKRQVEGEDYAAATDFNTTKSSAESSGDEENMQVGLRLVYETNMMIPQTSSDGLDMIVEFFTKDIMNQGNSAVLCVFNVKMNDPPPGVTVTNMEEEMLLSDQANSTAYDRIIVKFVVKNTNEESSLLTWKSSVTQVRNPSTKFDSTYLFNVGVEYYEETYIWVTQFPIIVKDSQDEEKMEWTVDAPSEIPLDSAGVFLIKAYVAIRSENLIFEVIAEDNDVVSVGNLGVKDFAVNYDPVPQDIYYYNTTMTGSDDDYIYSAAKLDLGVMTNVGDYTKPIEDGNLITLTFAIYALNFEKNIDMVVPYTVNFYTADKKFATTDDGKVTIIAREEKDKTIESRNTSWILTNPVAAPGDMVMYQIWSNLSYGGYADYVLQVKVPQDDNGLPALEACSARLWKYSRNFDVPFLNTTFVDPELDGDTYIFKFDRIHVTDQRDPAIYEDSMMFVHLIIKVSSLDANAPEVTLTPEVYFGTQGSPDEQIDVGSITVKENEVSQPPQLVAQNAVAWEDLYVGGTMVLNVTITVPVAQGYSETFVEISGAKDPPTPSIRVCRAELTEVERNLPCLRMHQDEVNEKFTSYKMSDESALTKPDIASLVLGDVGSLPVEGNNRAVISYIFELPANSEIEDNDVYSITSGITIRKELSKEFIANYTMKLGPPPVLEEDKAADANGTLVGEDSVLPGHTAEVLIVVNTKIQTISSYTIQIEAATADLCVYGIQVISFGRNLPCVDVDTEPFYELHDNLLDGNKIAGLKFPALSNVGFQPDSEQDALTIKGFIRLSSLCKEEKTNLKWRVSYGGTDREGDLTVNVDQSQDPSSKIIEGISDTPVFKPTYVNTAITIGSPIVVDFELSLKNNSVASVNLAIQTTDTSEKKGIYDVCLGGIVFRGKNYPCFSSIQVVSALSSSDSGNGHNDTANYNLGVICNTFIHKEIEEENKITMRIAMKAIDDGTLGIGDSFELQGETTVGSEKFPEILKFTVAAEAGQIESGTPNFKAVNESVIEIGIRERRWIAFNITIPVDSLLKVDVTAKAPLKDERAILTVHDMKLVSGGANIPCAMLYSRFEVLFKKEVKTTQSNVITACVGYFTNLGLTNRTNQAAEGDDDITILVEVEMSDHPEAKHEAEFDLMVEALVGETSLEAYQTLKVVRNGQEKPNLDVTVQVDDSKIYQSGESIDMFVTIVHNESSRAEPINAILRIFTPPYIEFKEDFDINATNIGEVKFETEGGGLDLVIPQFLFTDTITVGLRFLSDPNNKRGYGRGEVNATTPHRVLCTQTYRTEPIANPEVENSIISCGPVGHVVYTINSLECYQALGLSDSSKIQDCQLSASSAAKKETGPQNIRMGGDKGWSPALRLGMGNPYFQVDFQQTTRVAGIEFSKVEGTRCVTKFRLQHSYTGSDWFYANEATDLQYGDDNRATNRLEKPVQTRFVRMIIEEAENNEDDSKYVGVQMEIFGCYVAEKSEFVSCPKEDETWYSDNTKTCGRHFSVDMERDIAYFCDTEYNAKNVFCFSTTDGGNSWRVLPQNFGEIMGYDPDSKMTYVVDKRKRAFMASEDGTTWVPVKSADANATIVKDTFVQSHKIPAYTSEDIKNLNAKSGKWEATFNGLTYEGKDGLAAFWSKCCTSA